MTFVQNSWDASESVQSVDGLTRGLHDFRQTDDLAPQGKPTTQPHSNGDLRKVARLQLSQRVVNCLSLFMCALSGAVLAYGMTTHPEALRATGFFCVMGLMLGGLLFCSAQTWFQTELVVDPQNRELRILWLCSNGRRKAVLACGFDSVAGVCIDARGLTVLSHNGKTIADYRISDAQMLADLRHRVLQHLPVLP